MSHANAPAGYDPEKLDRAILQSLRRDLRDVLIPELSSENARGTARLLDEMLGWLALDLIETTTAQRPASSARARVQEDAERFAAEDAAAAKLSEELAAPLDEPVTKDNICAWIKTHIPSAPNVTNVTRVVGGYSKDTWIIALDQTLRGSEELILRRDLPFGPGENSVTEEFELLSRLAKAQIAAPEPLALEADPSLLGTPFLLFPRLPGRAIFDDASADRQIVRDVALQTAATMARFHALDACAIGMAPRDRTSAVRELVQTWRRKWERRRLYDSPVMDAALNWLADNAPASDAPARLVHGDVSFRNTLIEDGRLIALLDWEFHHLGDPAEDLSYFRLVAEPFLPWSDVIAAYEAAGGEPYDEKRSAFYDVWRSTRNAVTTATAWYGFVHGRYPASKAAYQGLSLHRFFLRDVAAKLESVL
jgi:aminoglycoside phosphotransferase (APT) family kinase protein